LLFLRVQKMLDTSIAQAVSASSEMTVPMIPVTSPALAKPLAGVPRRRARRPSAQAVMLAGSVREDADRAQHRDERRDPEHARPGCAGVARFRCERPRRWRQLASGHFELLDEARSSDLVTAFLVLGERQPPGQPVLAQQLHDAFTVVVSGADRGGRGCRSGPRSSVGELLSLAVPSEL